MDRADLLRSITTSVSSRAADRVELEELLTEYLFRLENGERPDRARIIAEHPELADDLEENLQKLEQLHRAAFGLSDGVSLEAATTCESAIPERLGDFEIVREIGRGGMGVVYEARQLSLDRRVALKVLPFVSVLDPKQAVRFQNEVQSAARLDHPHIVPVYSVGMDNGIHYYAMRLIDGYSLADAIEWLRENRTVNNERRDGSTSQNLCPVATETVAAYFSDVSTSVASNRRNFYRNIAKLAFQAADALEHAHSEGIVHRDVKPSNLLVDSDGQLWIADFGLATSQNDDNLTGTGDLVGTLRYMSPEQAAGRRSEVDRHSDIYSLGISLYELTTLRPAFEGDDRQKLLRSVLEESPVTPRQFDRFVPQDWETIILKATAKEIDQRYETAGELAEDLKRFIDERPIRARRVTTLERSWRWAKRNRAFAVAILSVAVLVCCLAVVGPFVAYRQSQLIARQQNTEQLLRQQLYDSRIPAIQAALRNLDFSGAKRLLLACIPKDNESDHRNLEWDYLSLKLQTLDNSIESIQLSGTPRCVCSSPNGRFVAVGSEYGWLEVFKRSEMTPVWQSHWQGDIKRQHSGTILGLSYSSDGSLLATGSEDQTLKIWNAETGDCLYNNEPGQRVHSVAFSPVAPILATGYAQLERNRKLVAGITLWRLVNTRRSAGRRLELTELASFPGIRARVRTLAFSNDGTRLAAGGDDGLISLYDVDRRELSRHFDTGGKAVFDVAFSPLNAAELASVSVGHGHYRPRRAIQVWNVTDPASPRKKIDDLHVSSICYSKDGQRLIGGGNNGVIGIWDIESEELEQTMTGHSDAIMDIGILPDRDELITTGYDRTIRYWHLASAGDNRDRLQGHGGPILNLAVSNDSSFVVSTSDDATARVWDSETGECLDVVETELGELMGVDISPNGNMIALGGGEFRKEDTLVEVFLYDRVDQKRTITLLSSPAREADTTLVYSVAFSPDGRRVAATVGREVRIWDVATGRELPSLTADGRIIRMAWAPARDSELIATASGGPVPKLQLWNASSGSLLGTLDSSQQGYLAVTFSRDASILAAAGSDSGEIRLFDTRAMRHLTDIPGHSSTVWGLDFSTDGERLLSAGNDVKLWNVTTGAELLSFRETNVPIWAVKFRPDGLAMFAAELSSYAPSIFVWRMANRDQSGL